MAANVENMFSVREVPWHLKGVVVQDAPSSEDAIRLAGLDWMVEGRPVFDQSGQEIPGYKINVRTSDNLNLGIVTDRYKIVQNNEAFAFTDALLGEGVKYETAGSLATGKRVWLMAKLAGTKICGDDFENYLVFTNTHDGTASIKVAITPVRVVCQNTLNLALQKAERKWSCAHKGNIQGKLEEAKMTLSNAQSYQEELIETLETMNEQSIAITDVKDIISQLLPMPVAVNGVEPTPRQIASVEDLRSELFFRYTDAPDLKSMKNSHYRLINAVTDFAAHTEPKRRTQNFEDNRFVAIIDGHPMMDKAFKLLAA